MEIDFKELLLKYIEHVGRSEGVDFIDDAHRDTTLFTDEEWVVLLAVKEESMTRYSP